MSKRKRSDEAALPADEEMVPVGKRILDVKVFSPYEVFYEGPAKSVSAFNARGPFDVLPGHIAFFSLLSFGTVSVDTGDGQETVPISHGILHVRGDKVTLFVFGLAPIEAAS